MLYEVRIEGESPVIHHSGLGIDPETPINREIAKITTKKASQRTSVENIRLRDLETIRSLWLTDEQQPEIPTAALRAVIEAAARKFKEGPSVREGMIVLESRFLYDSEKYGTDVEQLAKTTQFTVPVRVGQSRVLRTRARFNPPWSVEFTLDVDEELIDRENLHKWLELGGRRIGLGDWRPQKSGVCGRFRVASIEAVIDAV